MNNPSHERTLVLVKPDGVARGLIGEVISRIERKGLRIETIYMGGVTREFARIHYVSHTEKPYFAALVESLCAGAVVSMCVSGLHAVQVVRLLIGSTAGFIADPGTIRGDFSCSQRHNIVHASSSAEEAEYELRLWFETGVLNEGGDLSCKLDKSWVYTKEENP